MASGYHVQRVPVSFPYVGTNFNLLFLGINVMQIEEKEDENLRS
jgi:hypothetical protein